MVAVTEWRACKECADVLPLDRHHYAPTYVRKDGITRYRRTCRHCTVLAVQARDRMMRSLPETREAYLAERRRLFKQYAERNPENAAKWKAHKKYARRTEEQRERYNANRRRRYAENKEESRRKAREAYHANIDARRASLRASYARRKADPIRWAEYREHQKRWSDENRDRVNENRRMWTRLQAEREGRKFYARKGRKAEIVERFDPLPVAPLTDTIARLVDHYGITAVCAMTRVDHKYIKLILSNAEGATVPFDAADRICCGLGYNLFEFWPEQ